MINATEIRKGMVLKVEGDMFVVLECQHHTPGNLRAMMQVEMRSIKRGTKTSKRFRSTDAIEDAFVEVKPYEYLYKEGDDYIFMNVENYEQVPIFKEVIGDAAPYMMLNSQYRITYCDGQAVSIELPSSVVMTVVETEPGAKGDTRTNVFKPAKTETGLIVKVPLFLKQGEKIKIDTRTGLFLERSND